MTSQGDKDDKRDEDKIETLLRGNFLKQVQQNSDEHREHLKHWINLYHDRVRDDGRDINKIRDC
jgi:hypothetical protein